MPIDFFFRSLSENLTEKAICIILSGRLSDGTLGIKATECEGGLVMVEQPNTAKYVVMLKGAEIYLNKIAGRLREKELIVKSFDQNRLVVETILYRAEEEKGGVDLHGQPQAFRASRVFFGSNAVLVIHGVDRPFLIIRSKQDK